MLQQIRRAVRYRLLHRLDSFPARCRVIQLSLGFEQTTHGVIDRLGGVVLEYDPRSVIGRTLFASGTFEGPEIGFFTRLLAPVHSPTVLDIGANIGLHAITWAKALRNSTIYAFEPSLRTMDLLRGNVLRNGLQGAIEVVPTAVSNHCGVAQFFHCEDDAYSSLRDTGRMSVIQSHTVRVTTIDNFVAAQRIAHLHLIKIDVEGFETEVLQGGKDTLLKLRPHLFVEIFGGKKSNPDPEATIEYVKSLGYDAFVLKDGTPHPFSKHSDTLFNYYFKPLPTAAQ